MDDLDNQLLFAKMEVMTTHNAVYNGGSYKTNVENARRWTAAMANLKFLEDAKEITDDIKYTNKELDDVVITIIKTSNRAKVCADTYHNAPIKARDVAHAQMTVAQNACADANDYWLYLLTHLHSTREKLERMRKDREVVSELP
jgi:hypothetical protein